MTEDWFTIYLVKRYTMTAGIATPRQGIHIGFYAILRLGFPLHSSII